MRIKFTKDCEDIRPNRGKLLKSGLILNVGADLGSRYIVKGVAFDLDAPIEKTIVKKEKLK